MLGDPGQVLKSREHKDGETSKRRGSLAIAAAITALLPAVLLAPLSAEEKKVPNDFSEPTRHFTVERPADLTQKDALSIYGRIRDDMVSVYAMSTENGTRDYQSWRRYNHFPYRSATHGERYVNNYANMIAKAYGDYEDASELPAGSVLAKDSFAVTARGDVFTGPLFIMEKLPKGSGPETGDWRYSMVMPDGSVYGRTQGVGSERVAFCHTCHKTVAVEDHLFFVPRDNRVRFQKPGDPD